MRENKDQYKIIKKLNTEHHTMEEYFLIMETRTDVIEQATNDITKDILNYWRSYPDKFSTTIDAYNIIDAYIVDYVQDLKRNISTNILNDKQIDDIFKRVMN
jgi:hypothetical protein